MKDTTYTKNTHVLTSHILQLRYVCLIILLSISPSFCLWVHPFFFFKVAVTIHSICKHFKLMYHELEFNICFLFFRWNWNIVKCTDLLCVFHELWQMSKPCNLNLYQGKDHHQTHKALSCHLLVNSHICFPKKILLSRFFLI